MPEKDLEYSPRAEGVAVPELAKAFGLNDVRAWRDLGGTYNLNVLLDAGAGRYVMRVHREWVNSARLEQLHTIKLALHNACLPVVLPLATVQGTYWLASQGRLVELEPFVAHTHVADSWERYAAALGMLGRLHDALSVYSGQDTFVPPPVSNYGTPARLLAWTQRVSQKIRRNPESAAKTRALAICNVSCTLLQYLQRAWSEVAEQLPRQLIHGDYGGGNVLFEHEHIAGVLDFDFLGERERIYELAYTLYWMLNRLEGAAMEHASWSRAAELLSCYDTAIRQPLTLLEREHIVMEMVRVPLYWIAEANFLPHPELEIVRLAGRVQSAQWMFEQRHELASVFVHRT